MIDDFLIVVPAINRSDLVDSCIRSLDVDRNRHVMLIDNSSDGQFSKYRNETQYLHFGKNIGCSASWNHGLRVGMEWTIMVSVSVKFNNGITKLIEQLPVDPDKVFCQMFINGVAPGWHCVAIRKSCVDMIGNMDENFFPAYYEDTDLGTRLILAREIYKKPFIIHRLDVDSAENRGFALSVNSGTIPGINSINDKRLYDYYVAKWGGPPGHETFKTPFNSGKPISHWDFNNPFAPNFT
jgi:GT2 family glycosyltransferase